MKNIKIYESDLDNLILLGDKLLISIKNACFPDMYKWKITKEELKKLPKFEEKYQYWYSESLVLVKQLLPDRLEDFKLLFNKNRKRKEITWENFSIEDYLEGREVQRWWKTIVERNMCIPKFAQQVYIIKSIKKRFESSLFNIKQLVQADLFDSEVDVAEELCKKWFYRASWAVLWVVLESHLQQIITNHNLEVKKKNPMLNDLTEVLKSNNIIQVLEWRKLQHLADIRNTCDHKKGVEPKKEDIEDLINWVKRAIKNIF